MVGLQTMAEEGSTNCTANYDRHDRMAGLSGFSQCQLICAGRFVHTHNFFDLPRAVARRIDNQDNRSFLRQRLFLVSLDGVIHGQRHLIAFFKPDDSGKHHRKSRIELFGVVSNHRCRFAFEHHCPHHRAGTGFGIDLEIANHIFLQRARINNHLNRFSASTDHAFFIHFRNPLFRFLHAV